MIDLKSLGATRLFPCSFNVYIRCIVVEWKASKSERWRWNLWLIRLSAIAKGSLKLATWLLI